MNKKILSIIAAFLFSVILWGSVSLSGDYFISVYVPIRITDIPLHYTADGISAGEVFLRLKGEGWKLSSFSLDSDLEFKVSAGFDSGKVFLNLNRSINENEWLTSGIQVYDISPDTISTRIEKIFEKKVRVKPDYELQFQPGYNLASPVKINPESIVVYGTRRRLRNLDSIPTLKEVFSGLERKTVANLEIAPIGGLSYSTKSCSATFDVQKIVDKELKGVAIEILNVPKARDLLLFPNKIDIVLRGGINVLGKMNNDAVRVNVDYNKVLNDTTGAVKPELIIPNFTTLISTNPDRLKYIIKKY